ncbi:YIP1 family protein [bacterium]|nr:YIP1 family protein [bacterium]
MAKIRWAKMVDDTKTFFTDPVELYKNLEQEGGYLESLVYFIIMVFIVYLFFILSSTFFHTPLFAISIGIFILFIPLTLISFFVSTVILHIIWGALGSNENFDTSMRCNASFAPLLPACVLFSFIPFLGRWVGIVAYLFVLYFYVIFASVYVHKIEEEKAKKSFLTVFIILAVLRITGLAKSEIMVRRQKKQSQDMIRQMEENYQKQMEEYERQLKEQQRMYEKYQGESEEI